MTFFLAKSIGALQDGLSMDRKNQGWLNATAILFLLNSEEPVTSMRLPSVLSFTHHLIDMALVEGDVAIDATVGNGHDTLHLAQRVGDSGLVFGFDIQKAAIETTQARLLAAGIEHRSRLYLASHETMADWVNPSLLDRQVRAVMFNLGYRPGGDRLLITRAETTVAALEAALKLLSPGGLMTVVLYPGHPGGARESAAVQEWVQAQVPDHATVLRYEFLNPKSPPPILLALISRQGKNSAPPV